MSSSTREPTNLVPSHLFEACPGCAEAVEVHEVAPGLLVCAGCDHEFALDICEPRVGARVGAQAGAGRAALRRTA